MNSKSTLAMFMAFFFSISAYAAKPPDVGNLEQRVADLETLVTDLENLLAGVSRINDPNTLQDTLRFSGMNVQIVNGTGTTDGTPDGTGNLIIGYNELRFEGGDIRDGSHMLIVGDENNYSSFGGIVVGFFNETVGEYASVSGGSFNVASEIDSSVSGGAGNLASGPASSVSGGLVNVASEDFSSVSGGFSKDAVSNFCWEGDSVENC